MSATIKYIAKTCHEANRAYCQSIGDDSQPSWVDAPEWQKDSAIAGVKHHIKRPNSTPEYTHELWYDLKKADGWVQGDVKDAIAKTHPCMVPYDELPTEQKSKDYIFRAIILAMSGNL